MPHSLRAIGPDDATRGKSGHNPAMSKPIEDSRRESSLGDVSRIATRVLWFVRRALWGTSWRSIRLGAAVRWALSPYRRPVPDGSRRPLLIHDFRNQPISIGDLLMTRIAAEVLRRNNGAVFVDIALLYEPGMERHADPDLWHVNSANLVGTVGRVMQAMQIDATLGSIAIFNSRPELEHYVEGRAGDALVWPGVSWYAAGQYIYYEIFNQLLYGYFRQHGAVPQLHAGSDQREWALALIDRTASGRTPVTVQLRLNPHNTARNSRHEEWRKFLLQCGQSDPGYVFYIIGDRGERLDEFRALSNVVVARDHGGSLEGDLALIDTCHAHMGASSGPATMAVFSPKPYAIFGWKTADYRYRGLVMEKGVRRFYFASDAQRLVVDTETQALLAHEWSLIRSELEREAQCEPGTHAANGDGAIEQTRTGN